MLQSKQIDKVLSQALKPYSTNGTPPSTTVASSALSLSLLSRDGIPLTTVNNAILLTELGLTQDALRIYSLIGFNQMLSSDSWTIVQLESRLKLVIQRCGEFYVALFYEESFPDEVAKVKVENTARALEEGLKGYSEELKRDQENWPEGS